MNTQAYKNIIAKMTQDYTEQLEKSKKIMEQEEIDFIQNGVLPTAFYKTYAKQLREIHYKYIDFLFHAMVQEMEILSETEIKAIDKINDSLHDSIKFSLRYQWEKMVQEMDELGYDGYARKMMMRNA